MGQRAAGIPQAVGRMCERVADPLYDETGLPDIGEPALETKIGQAMGRVRASLDRMNWYAAGILWIASERFGTGPDFEILCRTEGLQPDTARRMVAAVERFMPGWCRAQRSWGRTPDMRPQDRKRLFDTARGDDRRVEGWSFDQHVMVCQEGLATG